MRAALLYGPGDLRIEELPPAEPGPGEVVLGVRAAMTCGTDVKMLRRGHRAIASYPSRFGHEFAGEVAAVGEGVASVAVGDRVFCANSAPCGDCFQCRAGRHSLCEDILYLLGGFGEEVVVPERIVRTNLHPLPPGLAMELAPMAEPLACAVHAVEAAAIRAGDGVAVVGGGSLGLMLCALVRAAGGSPIVLDPHPENLELARDFGAEATVTAHKDQRDVDAVRELAQGRGAGQVFEAVGDPRSWSLAIDMARPGGVVNLFGGCPSGTTVEVPTARIHYEQVRLQGTYHHTPAFVRTALSVLARGDAPWHKLCGDGEDLDALGPALTNPERGTRSKHLIVFAERR